MKCADKCVYYRDEDFIGIDLDDEARIISSEGDLLAPQIFAYAPKRESDGSLSQLLRTSRPSLNIQIKFSFLRQLESPENARRFTRTRPVRDRKLHLFAEARAEEIRKMIGKASE